jgi:hypothetical protein
MRSAISSVENVSDSSETQQNNLVARVIVLQQVHTLHYLPVYNILSPIDSPNDFFCLK